VFFDPHAGRAGRDQPAHRGGANASDAADIGTFEYQDEIFGDSFGG
jgi:hypothetical protein